ncbi:protein CutA homolog [Fundulus heteroclitus]|uniref:protein CutA homolog n=1 Tax=Fundulus heteroclitus TaxID=8078 RepID=UPI00165B5CAC|nr:protein CutA homolog [Fundulus heteroclitus]
MVVPLQRWLRDAPRSATVRSAVLTASLFLIVSISLYPGLRSVGVLLHAVFTGSYVPGYHSVLLINFPNEQAARDIGRSVMERRLAASVNILPRTFTMYYWKGEIQDASEILMLVKTKTSRIQDVVDYVRSIHPYANPEALSFPVGDGSQAYMKWMDDAVPDD